VSASHYSLAYVAWRAVSYVRSIPMLLGGLRSCQFDHLCHLAGCYSCQVEVGELRCRSIGVTLSFFAHNLLDFGVGCQSHAVT
jgi:hypothetical protein